MRTLKETMTSDVFAMTPAPPSPRRRQHAEGAVRFGVVLEGSTLMGIFTERDCSARPRHAPT